jgi:2-methylcitrate dehydratase PrpD
MQDALSSAGVETQSVSARLADFVTGLRPDEVTPAALTWASHALLDWTGVSLAARDEPVVAMLLADAETTSDNGACTLVGQTARAGLYDTALINGAAGHALDYDDVIRAMGGHPSVPTIPVALALAETRGHSGREMLCAIVAGFEVGCALGRMSGTSHYERGFHNTATFGTFAAAATAGRLLGLDAEQMQRAFGLAASLASGLKCNFGTMTKPMHAGLAAQSGLRAARLAAAGFTSNPDALEVAQGFVPTQVPEFDTTVWSDPRMSGEGFAIEQTLFKYHAACYGTHGVLEAIGKLRREHGVSLDDLKAMRLFVNTRSAGNCNQPDPKTGLALKFSIRHLATAALAGEDTAALDTYSAETATNPTYVAARDRVTGEFEPERDRMTARVELDTTDGRTLSADADVGVPAADTEDQWRKLAAKFSSLSEPLIGAERADAIKGAIAGMSEATDVSRFVALLARG